MPPPPSPSGGFQLRSPPPLSSGHPSPQPRPPLLSAQTTLPSAQTTPKTRPPSPQLRLPLPSYQTTHSLSSDQPSLQLRPPLPSAQATPPLSPDHPSPLPRRPLPSVQTTPMTSLPLPSAQTIPPLSSTEWLSDQDREIVADLDNRITEIQKDLEKCMQARQELEHMVMVTEGTEHAEAEDNLAFYNANITGLSQEMQQLKASLYEVHPERAAEDAVNEQRMADTQRHVEEERRRVEEEKKHQEEAQLKRCEKRARVIEEVIQTERDYLHGLTLTMETFLTPEAEKCVCIDLETLFGNIDEVIEVSQKLLTRLEGGSSGRDFDKQVIGQSFVTLKEDLKKVYAPYCRNHDDVIAMLEKYEESEEIQAYFMRMLDTLRKHITAFDLGSMLIKPVQRILKYPLLLNELIKATEDDHVDKQPLLNAINAMTDVAAAINEYKRRKDLVLKYRTDRDEKLTDKIARLSMHSTKKKLSRITQRMVGIQTIDEAYNKEERKVMSLEKGVRSLVRDIALFIEQLQETVSLQESIANDIADYYGEKSGQQEVQQFCTVHNVIASNLFHQFKFNMEGEVLCPLNRLIMMLSGPAKVMKKRHDKLLDYDHAQVKVKSTKDVELRMAQQELNRMKNDYEALNAQLLDDLPRLYDLAIEIVIECIARLITIQKTSHQKALDEMFHLLSVPLVLGDDGAPLAEAFNIAHTVAVEALSDISFIPRAFNPRLEPKATKRLSTAHSQIQESSDFSQSEGQRVYLTQVYPLDRLYRVVADAPATQPMDLPCPGGSLVGVIKEGDPMGNKDRWFIDNGAIKGFIMKRHLVPYQPVVVATMAGGASRRSADGLRPRQSISPTMSMTSDLMDLSSPPRDTPPSTSEPSAKAVEAGVSSPVNEQLGLDFLQQPEPSEEKVSLSDTDVHSIDWGMSVVQPGTADYTRLGPQDDDSPPTYAEVQEVQPPLSTTPLFRAIYPFQARALIEVTMEEGQLVKVIMQRDLDGNTEWWLVEVNGKQGYVPSNYLYQTTQ